MSPTKSNAPRTEEEHDTVVPPLLIFAAICSLIFTILVALVPRANEDALDVLVAPPGSGYRLYSVSASFAITSWITFFVSRYPLVVALVALLVSLRQRRWQISSNVLAGVALILFVLSLTIPTAIGRLGPGGIPNSFPAMGVATSVAFYLLIAALVWRYRCPTPYRVLATFVGLIAVVGTCIESVYFESGWATDAIGGLFLGLALLSLSLWVNDRLQGL